MQAALTAPIASLALTLGALASDFDLVLTGRPLSEGE